MNRQKGPQSQSALTSFIVNIVIPVSVLTFMSEGPYDITNRSNARDVWDLGPIWSMATALSLPFLYGIWALTKQKKFELMSAVGLVSVILTGTITFFVVSPKGDINPSTPWLYGIKEALIPLSLAIAVFVSHLKKTPLLRTFVYSPQLFNIELIEKSIKKNHQEEEYNSILWIATLTLTGALFLSSVGNYFMAHHYLEEVLALPENIRHLAYNQAVGKITGLTFLIIAVPMIVSLLYIVVRLMSELHKLTGLQERDIMPKS